MAPMTKLWRNKKSTLRTNVGRHNFVLTLALALIVAVFLFLYTGAVLIFALDEANPPHPSSSAIAPRLTSGAARPTAHNGIEDDAKNRNTSAIDNGATQIPGTQVLIPSKSSRPVEVVYAFPSGDSGGDVSGIAVLLHACTHSALKFFSPGESCKACVGLSEELAIVRAVMARGYLPLAVSSSDRQRGCWGSKEDKENVEAALAWFRAELSATHSISDDGVVVSVGASSGGRFAASLAADGVTEAGLVMVMAIGERLRSRFAKMGSKLMPPIYLAPMVRDAATARAARSDWEALRSLGAMKDGNSGASFSEASVIPIHLDEKSCRPMPVTSDFLHRRVPGLGIVAARAIVSDLISAGHLDATTLLLIKDPTRSDWRDVLRSRCGAVDNTMATDGIKIGGTEEPEEGGCLRGQILTPGYSPLAKGLHRAWAFHEYCSEAVFPGLDFIEEVLLSRRRDKVAKSIDF